MSFRGNSTVKLELLARWMVEPEYTLEFKEARNSYSFDKLREYCVALSNEGGGELVFGVSDQIPRRVVGTGAFPNPEKLANQLLSEFRIRIECEEINHPDGRVLIVHIPSHPLGRPLHLDGRYLMRSGESIVPMTPDQLSKLLSMVEPDFTALYCAGAVLDDLDSGAIEKFRLLLQERTGNLLLKNLPVSQLLSDFDLITTKGISNAAILLLGTRQSCSRLISQAELIFEYRNDDSSIRHQQRIEYQGGFLLWQEDLWITINLRNEVQYVQDGFFNHEIWTFSEAVIREAVLNAVSHRDYQLPASIFIRQYPNKLEIISPGGFPRGITSENILHKQFPRNRRLAETLQRCGLIERSGQGVDLMFNRSLREGKRQPNFEGTDEHEVRLLLRGDIQDPQFVKFLEKIGSESGFDFATEDLIVLDHISRSESLPELYKKRVANLIDAGIIERIGKGRGVRFLLSKRFYSFLGRPGLYTQRLGLDREANKALLLSHIARTEFRGAAVQELQQVLPVISRDTLKTLLRELRKDHKIFMQGSTRNARWYTPELLWKTRNKTQSFPKGNAI
jgi:ATP-dependent DNA helicase RecG